MNNTVPKISLIITTYNNIQALKLILRALNRQTTSNFEVVIADDGSTDDTRKMLVTLRPQLRYSLHHVWHEDKGFRASCIRNKAVVAAKNEYVIMIDGDCIPRTDFIERHARLAQIGYFVAGNRVLLTNTFADKILREQMDIADRGWIFWVTQRIQRRCNRTLALARFGDRPWRFRSAHQWQGVRTANFAIWKKDFMTVNGFDESYQGWGYEDSDLVIRLLRKGIKRKAGRFATTVFHLGHELADRKGTDANYARLQELQQSDRVLAQKGVRQYL